MIGILIFGGFMIIIAWVWIVCALFNLWLVWWSCDGYESDFYYNWALIFGLVLGPISTLTFIYYGYREFRKS